MAGWTRGGEEEEEEEEGEEEEGEMAPRALLSLLSNLTAHPDR